MQYQVVVAEQSENLRYNLAPLLRSVEVYLGGYG
jgi:hypothetical protein